MADWQTKQSFSYPRITLIPKHSMVPQNIVLDNVEETKPNVTPSFDSPPLSPREVQPHPMSSILKNVNPTTSETSSTILTTKTLVDDPIDVSTKSITRRVIVVGTLVLLCCAAVIVPTVLFVNLQQKSTNNPSNSNSSSSICSSTTCIGSETPYRVSTITALFPFDGNPNDLFGKYIGISYGSSPPVYGAVTNYIRSSIELRSTAFQYVRVPPMNFRQQSFTLQLWYLTYGSGTAIDYGLFSQCTSDGICLSLSVRNFRLFFSLNSMNSNGKTLSGRTITVDGYWNHVTVTYDAVLRQQAIYLNGRLDAISADVIEPYQGTTFSANAYIGLGFAANFTSSYFHGVIDHVTISIGVVRTTCQIYNDAGLFINFPFDSIDTLLDRSSNMIHGIGSRLNPISIGRLNQAIAFEYNTSYFQVQAFPTMRYTDVPFSLTLWIKPSAVLGGGSLAHISNFQNGTGVICYDLLGFTSSGILMAQLLISGTNIANLTGRILPLNIWSHVAVIYSLKSGFRLYINGQLSASTMVSVYTTNVNNYITLGNNSPGLSVSSSICSSSLIIAGPYRGAIDEFRIYNRELSMDELCILANI